MNENNLINGITLGSIVEYRIFILISASAFGLLQRERKKTDPQQLYCFSTSHNKNIHSLKECERISIHLIISANKHDSIYGELLNGANRMKSESSGEKKLLKHVLSIELALLEKKPHKRGEKMLTISLKSELPIEKC